MEKRQEELVGACWAVGDELIKDSGEMAPLKKLYDAAKAGKADPDELVQEAYATPYRGPRRALMIAADILRDRPIDIHIRRARALLTRDERRKALWMVCLEEHPALAEVV